LASATERTPALLDQIVLGQPSYVWRSGQERRLAMVRRHARLEAARLLDIGCGIGAYVRRFSDFTPHACGIDVDRDRVRRGGAAGVANLCTAVSESLPFADATFDAVLLNEVIEHVRDDRATIAEALRVTRPGGKVIIFAPNRLYPFETHGVYLGRRYLFGNIPLVNYLPDFLRRRLAPHARAYTKAGLEAITRGLPGRWTEWRVIYPGFDNVAGRRAALAGMFRALTYRLERTWFHRFGLSHLLVLERL
jgi:SAM-dependent methyltransferase